MEIICKYAFVENLFKFQSERFIGSRMKLHILETTSSAYIRVITDMSVYRMVSYNIHRNKVCNILIANTSPIYNTSDIGHREFQLRHYSGVIIGTMASQITSLTTVYSTVYSGADQRKYQSSASMAFVRGIHRSPVNSPHKRPVKRNFFAFDDVIMELWYQQADMCTGTPITKGNWFTVDKF